MRCGRPRLWRTVTRRSQQIALTLAAAAGRLPPNVCNVESAHGRAHLPATAHPSPAPTHTQTPRGPEHARQSALRVPTYNAQCVRI